jgi:hypothetical protein
MLAQRRAAMEAVTPELFAMESAIDAALLQATRLTASLIQQRQEAGLSAVVGQDAIERSGAAFATLLMARREVVATHNELGSLKKQIGLGAVVMTGNGGDKPDPQVATTGLDQASIRIVA